MQYKKSKLFGEPVSMRKMMMMAFPSLRQERETMRRLLFPQICPLTGKEQGN